MKSRRSFCANIFRTILSLTLLAMSTQLAKAAGVLYVKPIATGTGDCSSWADACALQTALANAASNSAEIWVMEGIHTPGGQRVNTFKLLNSVKVYGGFNGTETTLSERDWVNNITTLSGDIGTLNDISDNSYTVVTTNGDTLLDGFTVSGGNSNGPDSGYNSRMYGGGMYSLGVNSTIRNVIFSNNTARAGGGLYSRGNYPNTGDNLALQNVTFNNNHSLSSGGGGMANSYSNAILQNVTFNENTASGGGKWGNGGGLRNFFSNPTLENVTFNGNTTEGSGGGMYNQDDSSPILRDVTFNNNRADGYGGGMAGTGALKMCRII